MERDVLTPFLADMRRERRGAVFFAIPLLVLGGIILALVIHQRDNPGLTPGNYLIPGVIMLAIVFFLPAALIVRYAFGAPRRDAFWRAFTEDLSPIAWIYPLEGAARGVVVTLDYGYQRCFDVPVELAAGLHALVPHADHGWSEEREAQHQALLEDLR